MLKVHSDIKAAMNKGGGLGGGYIEHSRGKVTRLVIIAGAGSVSDEYILGTMLQRLSDINSGEMLKPRECRFDLTRLHDDSRTKYQNEIITIKEYCKALRIKFAI